MEIPSRKPNRLPEFDYSRAGYYFVTIITKNRKELFWKNTEQWKQVVRENFVLPPTVPLSPIGQVVHDEIQKWNKIYPNVAIDKFVIMPNHIHLIIAISSWEDACSANRGRTQFALTPKPSLPQMVKQFKGSVSKQIGFSPWHKSFHDHIIRNPEDYQRIWHYIDNNPITWNDDLYYIP